MGLWMGRLAVALGLPTPLEPRDPHVYRPPLPAGPCPCPRAGSGRLRPPPGPGHPHPTPTRTFATIDEAKACARDALASAGFLPQTLVFPGPDGAVVPGETPTSVNGRIITPLGTGQQVDLASAGARLRVGPQGDTTVTVGVSVKTHLWDDQNFGAVRPLSGAAVHARDAVQTRCMLPS